MPIIESMDTKNYNDRQQLLQDLLKKKFPKNKGIVVLFADFEKDCIPFKQEPSFYYLTGINEPAVAFVHDLDTENTMLYVPNFGGSREKWMADAISPHKNLESVIDVDEIKYLGEPCQGYMCHPFFSKHEFAHLLEYLATAIKEGRPIFTIAPDNAHAYIEQRYVLQRISAMLPGFKELLVDISPFVEHMRRIKNTKEIEFLYKAIDITSNAFFALAKEIRPGIIEYELEGLINYMFVGMGGSIAFPSIVASGKNATILHYHTNNKELKEGELLVIDIGAAYNHYCADLTRTFPVSGLFTDRQKEIYMMVLDTQEYIASLAKPGYWLSNKDQPEKSLHHLAVQFLAKKGYDQYFIHGIGHFLGLDVHDVGDYKKPLEKGDVITIEPGIYIPQEELGVRIEDNYWVVDDGVVCLSEELPKFPDEIEKMMKAEKL